MILLAVLIICELISVALFCVMHIHGCYDEMIPKYYEYDKKIPLGFMAFLGGWLFAPYFIYLAYKYIKTLNSNK